MKLKEEVDEGTYRKIQELRIKGVYGNFKHSRLYPNRNLASHVLGFVNKEDVAAMGVERFADYYLKDRMDGEKVRKMVVGEKCPSTDPWKLRRTMA